MHQRTRSLEVYEKLCEVIPGGVNSPIRSCKGMGQPPMVAERGEGDMIYDVDGHGYIDYCGSWGPLIHGHAHPAIIEAAQRRMAMGTSFGITTAIEEELARKVIQLVSSIEKIRFVSSGTEATMTAGRLARGFTKRDILVKYAGNYHGHADFFLVQAGSGMIGTTPTATSAGIPEDIIKHTVCLPYNDIEASRQYLRENGANVAAVILEPIVANMGLVAATPEFLAMLRQETQQAGALLIFDEVISGFRVGLQGAQGLYGITPDLTCFGKIIGGGFPAAAFGGRRDIMDCLAPLGPVYQAGTLSGNPVAMEAGLQSLRLLEKPGFYEELQRKTDIITRPVQELIQKKRLPACIQQIGSLFTLFFGKTEVHAMDRGLDLEKYAAFFRFMFAQGVYIPPLQYEVWFVSMAHKEENLKKTRDLMLEFLSCKVE